MRGSRPLNPAVLSPFDRLFAHANKRSRSLRASHKLIFPRIPISGPSIFVSLNQGWFRIVRYVLSPHVLPINPANLIVGLWRPGAVCTFGGVPFAALYPTTMGCGPLGEEEVLTGRPHFMSGKGRVAPISIDASRRHGYSKSVVFRLSERGLR